jgi:hypothetical protein
MYGTGRTSSLQPRFGRRTPSSATAGHFWYKWVDGPPKEASIA